MILRKKELSASLSRRMQVHTKENKDDQIYNNWIRVRGRIRRVRIWFWITFYSYGCFFDGCLLLWTSQENYSHFADFEQAIELFVIILLSTSPKKLIVVLLTLNKPKNYSHFTTLSKPKNICRFAETFFLEPSDFPTIWRLLLQFSMWRLLRCEDF